MVLIFPQAEQHKLRLAAVGICCRMFNAVLRLHWITRPGPERGSAMKHQPRVKVRTPGTVE